MFNLKGYLSEKDGTPSSSRLFGYYAVVAMCISLLGLTYAAITSEKDMSMALGVVVAALSGVAGFNYYNNTKKSIASESSVDDIPKDN